MKRPALIALGLAAALIVPASAAPRVKPTPGEKRVARAECLAERGVTRADHLEFAAKYGRRPLRRCIRIVAQELAAEHRLEWIQAWNECRAEYRADPIGFREEYPGPRPIRLCVRMELAP